MKKTNIEWLLIALALRIFTMLSAVLALLIQTGWIRAVILGVSLVTWLLVVCFSEFRNPIFNGIYDNNERSKVPVVKI